METIDLSDSISQNPKSDENIDPISNLPEPIIHRIFSFLETIDAIRASAVCKKWRYIWFSVPCLDFNILSVWKDPQARWPLQIIHEKFKDFVNYVLASQDRNCDIQRFHLSCIDFPSDYTIQRWMNIVTGRNAREIMLCVLSRTPFRLPSCLLTSKSLVNLNLNFLGACDLNLPKFLGLSCLKILKLRFAVFRDEDAFQSFISSCPNLEKLKTRSCGFPGFKNLHICLENLQELNVITGYEGVFNLVVRIDCPNLKRLVYSGPLPPSFLLQNIVSLDNAAIHIEPVVSFSVTEHGRVVGEFLRMFEKVENLKLDSPFAECLYEGFTMTSSRNLQRFNNLKSLWLSKSLCRHDWAFLIGFLKSSPRLEALTVQFEPEAMFARLCGIQSCREIPGEEIVCLTQCLKTATVLNVVGDENEVELIRFLLKKGCVLEEMRIVWSVDAENTEESMERITDNLPPCSEGVSLTSVERRMFGLRRQLG